MITYSGNLIDKGTGAQTVYKGDRILSPARSQKLYNHSPDGFNWGYYGSGPAQLALALLYDVTGDKELSLRLHQKFKYDHVGNWKVEWAIDSDKIREWIKLNEMNICIDEVNIFRNTKYKDKVKEF